MRKMLIAMLLVLATAFACNATVDNLVIGATEDCIAAENIYSGETFYLCGEIDLNGETLTAGNIVASETTMGENNAAITNGKFAIPITANVNEHQYYYLNLALESPCEKEFEELPVEIKSECVMVTPSTIEAVPNVVEQGKEFVLEVKNAPTDVQMEVTGISSSITTLLAKGDSWSQTFPSTSCSALGSCVIQFQFTDVNHELCKANTNVMMTVKAPAQTGVDEERDDTPIALATLFILVIGTIGAVLLNRYI